MPILAAIGLGNSALCPFSRFLCLGLFHLPAPVRLQDARKNSGKLASELCSRVSLTVIRHTSKIQVIYIYIHICIYIYIYVCGSRSKGLCKDLHMRRPSVLVEKSSRDIRHRVAKATFVLCESCA